MNLDLFNDLVKNTKANVLVTKFIKELGEFLENKDNLEKYSEYWKYQNFMEDSVSANLGLSRWSNDITYYDELGKAIDDSILELSKTEGALFRKKFSGNGEIGNQTFAVDKFENGKIEHLNLPKEKVPLEFRDKDVIFSYNEERVPTVRMDLNEKIINLASQKASSLKVREDEKAKDFKREGHIYEAFEDDGYVFLNDLTEEREYSLEDIDFVTTCYKGEGKYQVLNGKYEKI